MTSSSRPDARVPLCVLLSLLLFGVSVGLASDGLQHGVWDVSTLLPGRGAVPPNYELTVEPGRWTVTERDGGRLGRFLDAAAARVGLVYTGVPGDAHALCRMPEALSLRLAAAQTDEGMRLECQSVWLTPAEVREFAQNGVLHRRLEPAELLYSVVNGTCVATPWRVQELYVTKAAEDTVLLTGVFLHDTATAAEGRCHAHFELRRRSAVATTSSALSNAYGPITMLIIVVAVRMLPRYVLTRRGQLDKTSFRGKNPAQLTPAQRLRLLRQQREIIEKMKAEDRASASAGAAGG
ncbi:hypothetical protein NESM_000670700 [Novymonas esmeraldas]|uniref:Uncharacterized protein n=1 Tax=Novymonas esmeraldas TaxID=1808958 RepID=A0AAW0EVU1_9TRYP